MRKASLLTVAIAGLTTAGIIIFPLFFLRAVVCIVLFLSSLVILMLLNLIISLLLKEKSWADSIDEYFKK